MSAIILDGRSVAKAIRSALRAEIAALPRPPHLAVVQVAGDAASDRYVRSIRSMCEEVGAVFVSRALPGDIAQAALEATLAALSADASIDGIILQLPLPVGLHADAAIAQIDPHKDVDGVTPQSAGLLMLGQPGLRPNTPAGGMALLKHYTIPIAGRRAVVVGRSPIVGRPMALLLLHEHATVTIAHSRTPNLAAIVREAEIVIAAVGKPGLITADMIQPGATVIDFGINVAASGTIVGDVDYAGVVAIAGAITPVPGGTGPMTNAMLLQNLIEAAK
ncbi:MAG: bifunctional 5,10-methylenetetrahydrofolate dehydrogenase/5,10-methenyltetrahydrofolate cyclohydrolase [Roseiflexaceae bacterium]|nr:bifunctional 5,10-methylenetetrahydrofolate dehydrogenase/5,10-methenyltetrahydrofolate cyclohydrolase [Roseiflexaceae bacterium]